MGKKQKLFITLIMFSLLVVLFSGFFYSVYTNTIDKSSYTDWISAFCNVVIAGATVGAVITARNYLAQFTAQEGYKLAIKLVNEDFPKIKENLSIINQEYVNIDKFFNSMTKETVITDITALSLINLLNITSAKIMGIKKEVLSHLDKDLWS